MITNKQIQEAIPTSQPVNFCVAPFISTMQTTYGKTSPCAYGVTEWQYDALTPAERWSSTELNAMRMEFIQGKTPAPCIKCVNEEHSNKDSLRIRMQQWFPTAYKDFIQTGQWQSGPMLISSKVSNVCNLSCRSCAGWDSNSFKNEGLHYKAVYKTDHPGTPGNRFIPRLLPRHTDYSKFTEIDRNLVKLEFFGGEPLLNLTHLEFLEHLIATGKSKDITIFYSTNCTQAINPRFIRIWREFKKLEFSLSIDDIGQKFEYLRWPAVWSDVEKNVNSIINLPSVLGIPVSCVVSSCATINNAYYVDEIVKWANDTVGSSYINMVASPGYVALHVAPDDVKAAIAAHVSNPEVRGFMQIQPHDPLEWKRWIIWTKRQDLYRNQSFPETFPEFYNIIRPYWDAVTDLSEDNFNV